MLSQSAIPIGHAAFFKIDSRTGDEKIYAAANRNFGPEPKTEPLVRKAGLEPASLFRRQLLRLVCLPFHHFRTIQEPSHILCRMRAGKGFQPGTVAAVILMRCVILT